MTFRHPGKEKRMIGKTALWGLVLLLALNSGVSWLCGAPPESVRPASGVLFATYVQDPLQERKAAQLVDSIRRFGGSWANAPVYVAVAGANRLPCPNLGRRNVRMLPLEGDAAGLAYPFGRKVYAAAQIEAAAGKDTTSMIWLDPECLILAPPAGLVLDGETEAAVRPVFLGNRVALPVGAAPDAFWERIYGEAGVDPAGVPEVKPEFEPSRIRFYVNCEVMAIRPSLGLCRRWAEVFTRLVGEEAFQDRACADGPHRIFLHQAVLSAILAGGTKPAHRRGLDLACGYPLHLLKRIPPERRLARIDDATALIYEDFFETSPETLESLPMGEPFRSFLRSVRDGLLRISDRIWREEGSCNTYLVTTPAGNVVIDPAGASGPGSRLRELGRAAPLLAILLTHGHDDHRSGIPLWKEGRDILVVAQREIGEFLACQDRLQDFFRVRNAAHSGQPAPPAPKDPVATPVEATVLYDREHTFRAGGLTFQLFHTGGETPDTGLVWIPELRAAFVGDNFYKSFPMIYTPRGTRPRWALDYVAALEKAMALEPEILLPGHDEPVVGAAFVRRRLGEYRDAILHVHDAVVRGMNEGHSVFELMREIRLPEGSRVEESYGKVSWAVRGIFEGYAGWFDGNPAHLFDRPDSAIWPDLVRLAGGAARVVELGGRKLEAGDALGALQLADAALSAEPADSRARDLRLRAIQALMARSRNGAELRWLRHGLKTQERP